MLFHKACACEVKILDCQLSKIVSFISVPDSCTLVSSSTCRLNSTECSFTATFNLLRPLSRSREYDVTWWFNNNLVYGNTDDFSASEMTMDCTKCSARLFIKGTFKQHHFGDYTFKIRRIKSGEIINCTLRLCEDCQRKFSRINYLIQRVLYYIVFP